MNSIFPSDRNLIVRISFKDGEVFRLRSCNAVDKTIYDKKGLWSGEIVEILKRPNSKLELRAGTGLDFSEQDIAEIFDESSQQVTFKR
jgi:hypothetical protein